MAAGDKTIGVGFLGAGSISLLHFKGIQATGGAKLVGLYNRTKESREATAREYGCKPYDTVEALLADPAVDAVFVLSHMDTHVPYAKAALAAGKHVLVEKPVAGSIAEIEELRKAVAKAGKVCMPVHNYVYEPSLWRARAMIAAGEIGKLSSVYVMYNIHHPEEVARNYPGVISQIMTHHSYILLYLAGKPRRVSAFKSVVSYKQYKEEEQASVILEMPDGCLAHFFAGFTADDHTSDPWTCLVKVLGTHGGARFSYRDWVSTIKRGEKQIHSQWYEAYQGGITETVRHFLDGCVRRGQAPLSTLEDAVTAQKMVEAIAASAGQGRAVEVG
jgi:predicted dehydrogenase